MHYKFRKKHVEKTSFSYNASLNKIEPNTYFYDCFHKVINILLIIAMILYNLPTQNSKEPKYFNDSLPTDRLQI